MISVQSFSLPPVNRREILRYAGVQEETPELTALLEETLDEVTPRLTGKVCWSEFPVSGTGNREFCPRFSPSLPVFLPFIRFVKPV